MGIIRNSLAKLAKAITGNRFIAKGVLRGTQWLGKLEKKNSLEDCAFFSARLHFVIASKDRPPLDVGEFGMPLIADTSHFSASVIDYVQETFKDDYHAQIHFLEGYLAKYPEDHFVYLALAILHFDNQKYYESIRCCESLFELAPRNMHGIHLMKRAYEQLMHENSSLDGLNHYYRSLLFEDMKGVICPNSGTSYIISSAGEVNICCDAVMPFSIGNIFKHEWEDIINSQEAQVIRSSVKDGSYKYCNRLTCDRFKFLIEYKKNPEKALLKLPGFSIKQYTRFNVGKRVVGVGTVSVGYDESCNLACPQCRKDFVKLTEEQQEQIEFAHQNTIPGILQTCECIVVANTGDPFASKSYFDLLKQIDKDKHPNLKDVVLNTNAILFTPERWDELKNLHHLNITVNVSVDANSAKTYEVLRWPGKWETLVKNLEFIGHLRKQGAINRFHSVFVLQAANFKELKGFATRFFDLNGDHLLIAKFLNIINYSTDTYLKSNIVNSAHPQHDELIRELRDPIFKDDRIQFSGLSSLLGEPDA